MATEQGRGLRPKPGCRWASRIAQQPGVLKLASPQAVAVLAPAPQQTTPMLAALVETPAGEAAAPADASPAITAEIVRVVGSGQLRRQAERRVWCVQCVRGCVRVCVWVRF
jgi:hypothetical protein